MNPIKLRTLLLPLAAFLPMAGTHAAVKISSPAVPDPFAAVPAVTDWSTASFGTATDAAILTAEQFDTKIIAAANITAITTVLGSSGTIPPSANAIARQNTGANNGGITFLQTRPTGVDYLLLAAHLTNDTGAALNSVRVAYDYSKDTVTDTETVKGLRAFWSLTGAPGSWEMIPSLSVDTAATYATPEAISATISLSSPLAAGGTMYLLWADQNSSGTDASYHIDNFAAGPGVNCSITGAVSGVVRHNGVDPADPSDDTVTFTATVTGTGDLSASGWVITSPAGLAGPAGAYGAPVTLTAPVSSFTNGVLKVQIADFTEPACTSSLSVAASHVIGTNSISGVNLPLLTSGPVAAGWAIDETIRVSTQTGSNQVDHVVESQLIDLSAFGFASITAELSATAGASSGFEAADSFAMQVIIDGGTPISILGSTNDTNNDGRLTGGVAGAGSELPDAGVVNFTKDFTFNYIVPATANSVQIRFIGNSNSTSETFVVKNLSIGTAPATLFTTLSSGPVLNNQGTVDPSDDTFSAGVTILPVNLGPANTGWISNEPPPAGGLYSAPNPVTFGPFLATGGARNITLTDTTDAGINTSFVINPPVPALTVSAPANIVRVENGPGVDDDTVTFDVILTGTNAGTGWEATGAVTSSGSYGPGAVTLTIPAALPASPASVTFTDNSYPTATQTVSIAFPARYIIGQRDFGSGNVDVLSSPATNPDPLWVNDSALRTLTLSAGVATDSIVTSEVLNLAAVGKVNFTANLNARETSTGSNFETADRFKAVLLIDGGLTPANVINLVDAYDKGDGASSTAVATSGLNGPKNGYINGYQGTAGTDIITSIVHATALEEYNANNNRDEFNIKETAPGVLEPGANQLDNNFPLSYEIPEGANSVQLVIYGANAAGSEFLTLSDVKFTASGVTPPATDNDGDGVSNADEAIMGTDPNNANDVLRLTNNAGNPSQIDFPTKDGRFYRVYVSDDNNEATHLQVWKDSGLATIAGNGATASFTLAVLPGEARRFYRLHVMQTDGNGGVWPATVPAP